MIHEGNEVMFDWSMGDMDKHGFNTEKEARDDVESYMKGHGLRGTYHIFGKVKGKVYRKYGGEYQLS